MNEVYADVVEQVSDALVAALGANEKLVVDGILHLDVSVRELVRRVGRRTMEKAFGAVASGVVEVAREQGYIINRSQSIEVSCLFGPVRVDSPYLCKRGTGDTARPVRDELGLTHACKTPAVERALADFGIEDSFQLASERFAEHYGWNVGRTSVLRVVHAQAEAAERYIEHRLSSPAEQDIPRPGVLLLEMDGCELRTAELGPPDETEKTAVRELPKRHRVSQWRDVRLAFTRPLAAEDKTFVGGMRPYNEVVEQLHQAALHQGLDHQTVVAAVVDGGIGLREAIEDRFGDIICVLDRPHLTAHLHDVAKEMGKDDRERHAWVKEQVADLYDGRVDKVLVRLGGYTGPGEERVQQFYRHLWRFQDAVDYGFAHAWGIPQGSGEIESAHRYVPQRRLKLPGAAWHPSSINPILALRLVRANGWWGDFWDHQTSNQAAA